MTIVVIASGCLDYNPPSDLKGNLADELGYRYFSDMDAEIAALEAKLAKTRRLKQGMMQELLTGRIRLV
mgnify:CR=1 FL=1